MVTAPLVTATDDLEEQVGTGFIDRQEAELVDERLAQRSSTSSDIFRSTSSVPTYCSRSSPSAMSAAPSS
jgi:hypothetical protein